MFSRLLLKNFQRHKRLEIKVENRITTIVGPTDAGKSAIIRALRWVCTNQPSGLAGLIRDGAQSVVVELDVDKHTIRRERSKGKNLYWLDDQKFNAFGSKVPEPIAELLKLVDMNFQFQLDPVFWFSQNAGQVSKELNKIVNLDDIDKALTFSKNLVTKAKGRKELLEEDLALNKGQVAEWAWTKQADADLRAIEELVSQWQKIHKRMGALYSAHLAIQEGEQIVADDAELEADAAAIATMAVKVSGIKSKLDDLKKYQFYWTDLEKELCHAKEKLQETKLKVGQSPSLCPTCGRPLGP